MKLHAFVLPLLLYPLYAGVMYAKQASILFPAASPAHHAFIGELPVGAALVEVPVSFGSARAIYWPARNVAKPTATVWYAHGNYETVENSFELVQPLIQQGIAVMQFEFPGYDGADGEATSHAISEAATATWDWLAHQPAVDPAQMVAMGYSIGGGPAAEMTVHRRVRALVLLSTYSSLADLAHRYLLPAFLLRFGYDNIARVRAFDGPVFVEHGRRDEVIPYRLGTRLAAAKPGIEFLQQDCGHADCQFDRSVFAARLPDWLAANGVIPRTRVEQSP